MKIVCLGDSLTGPGPETPYLNAYVKWPDLVQLGADATLGRGCATVINQGKAGEVSSGLLARMDERLVRHAPDVAIIWIGANNFAGGVNRDEATAALASDLREIVHLSASAGALTLLLQYPEPRAAVMDRVWRHASAGNDAIAMVALEAEVPLLDLRPAFHAAAVRWRLDHLACPVDGVHLRPGGELVVARAVLERLSELDRLRADSFSASRGVLAV